MAEVQTTTESGEMTQCFIQFVMMQQQNAAFCLGLIPNPQTGKGEVNLDFARMMIDQLVMIREKTRGNLNDDELKILNSALTHLQMAFIEVSKNPGVGPVGTGAAPELAAEPEAAGSESGADDAKKKFTKSYGA